MRRISRIGILQASLTALMVALIAKAAQVQLWQGRDWAAKAAKQHREPAPVLVPRGPILDATGAVLVESRNVVHLRVAPREVKNRSALAVLLTRAHVDPAWVRRATDTTEKWVEIPGHYLASDVQPITAVPGVHPEMLVDRVPIASEGLRRLIGYTPGTTPGDGLEATLDSVLRGVAAPEMLLRDARGTQFEAPGGEPASPRQGDTVVLTINNALQEICERALANEVAAEGASGGDIVVVDPHDGSILAMASGRRDPRSIEATALTEPFEPGSTVKPLIAASLLARGKATPDETIDTHGGTFEIEGRTLTDEHKADRLSLRDVIRLSSNIGIAEFAQRLTRGEEYETLRDLGFGMPTGVPYPAESPGTLRRPIDWSKQSPASLAIGYELAVTPLQLALAYAAIANGGELLEPGLIREIKRSDGTVLYRHVRRAIRRVMPVTIADTVRAMLVETVAHGTGSKADLSTFAVAGKTGTARRTEKNRGYVAGEYTATFVGLFPAADPQYVILVKINDPPARGASYFASKAAAPVAKTVLEAAIAARDASLDRGVLAHKQTSAETTMVAAAEVESSATVDLPLRPARSVPRGAPRAVPDVRGMPLRAAVRALHRAGLHVELTDGPSGVTSPPSGTIVPEGAIVRLNR
jgi:cell division protein FtsI (penicillin-binding protein 3)